MPIDPFYENNHPYRLGNVARQLPETRILMVHMGGNLARFVEGKQPIGFQRQEDLPL
jgi:predicted TIM-barrel fold metal-dependent hydrolase